MARVLHNLLLFVTRLALRIRLVGYWSLVYGYCALCAAVALLKLWWSVVLRPTATFQWVVRETPPACLNDTSLGTHCYVRIKESGLRFHYVAAGERGKPLMLFLHGFPEFWFSWRYQLREFKSEFRVVAVDMRGYGESDLPLSTENYSFDYLVTDVKDIVEYLGYNRCCLVGHDWGGTIAWLFAIHYPEMVTKLIVLNCPHPSVFTDYALRHPSQLLKSSHFFFFQLPRFPELMLSINDFKALKALFTSRNTGIGRKGRWLTAEDLEAYLYALSQPGALTGALNYYRNVFRWEVHSCQCGNREMDIKKPEKQIVFTIRDNGVGNSFAVISGRGCMT
uniref:Epoxide hydrolase 4 n=1 Tax=Nothobranchius furzeri TaxID=105023 RepID=A0A1A8B4X9_NOTFU